MRIGQPAKSKALTAVLPAAAAHSQVYTQHVAAVDLSGYDHNERMNRILLMWNVI